MYALGGALGPVGMGYLSEYFTERAATTAGIDWQTLDSVQQYKALEPYRPHGIRDAMYALPAIGVVLAGTLYLGAMTVRRDVDKLHRWMRESAEAEAASGGAGT